MTVGDLVRCPTANGALGLVVAFGEGRFCIDLVGVILAHNNRECWFQTQHLELVCT